MRTLVVYYERDFGRNCLQMKSIRTERMKEIDPLQELMRDSLASDIV
jgi:hypothetical protein